MPELPPVTSATRPARSNSVAIGAAASQSSQLDDHRVAAVERSPGKYFAQAVVGRARMRLHAFEPRDARRHLRRSSRLASRVMRCQVSVFMNLCTDSPPE